jgi:hypothetical protein
LRELSAPVSSWARLQEIFANVGLRGGGRGTGIQHSLSWGQRSPVPRLPWRAHVGPTRPVNLPDVRFTSNSYRALALQRNDATCHEPTYAAQQIWSIAVGTRVTSRPPQSPARKLIQAKVKLNAGLPGFRVGKASDPFEVRRGIFSSGITPTGEIPRDRVPLKPGALLHD